MAGGPPEPGLAQGAGPGLSWVDHGITGNARAALTRDASDHGADDAVLQPQPLGACARFQLSARSGGWLQYRCVIFPTIGVPDVALVAQHLHRDGRVVHGHRSRPGAVEIAEWYGSDSGFTRELACVVAKHSPERRASASLNCGDAIGLQTRALLL